VRLAWSHILFPVKTEATAAGAPFDLDHLSIASKDRSAIPVGVYEKAKNDGIAKEKLGPDALALHLKPLWPEDRPHLAISEIADWFASYVYLPKLRDRVVLDVSIRFSVMLIGLTRRRAPTAASPSARHRRNIFRHPPSFSAPNSRARCPARRNQPRAKADRPTGPPAPRMSSGAAKLRVLPRSRKSRSRSASMCREPQSSAARIAIIGRLCPKSLQQV
jgi:hypothetical protein